MPSELGQETVVPVAANEEDVDVVDNDADIEVEIEDSEDIEDIEEAADDDDEDDADELSVVVVELLPEIRRAVQTEFDTMVPILLFM